MKVGDTVTVTAAPEEWENLVGKTGTIKRTARFMGGFIVAFPSGWACGFRAEDLEMAR